MIYCTSTHKQVQCRKFVKTYRHKTIISPWQCLKETKTKPPLQISFLFIIYLTYNNVSFEQWNGKWKDVEKLAPFESEKFAHEKSPLQGSLPKFLPFLLRESIIWLLLLLLLLVPFSIRPFLIPLSSRFLDIKTLVLHSEHISDIKCRILFKLETWKINNQLAFNCGVSLFNAARQLKDQNFKGHICPQMTLATLWQYWKTSLC